MTQEKYKQAIFTLNEEIAKNSGNAELYYKRGYFYFLLKDENLAQNDYKKAVSLDLDPTEFPYYSFSASNELRRDFVFPEKLLVVLILIVVCLSLMMQISEFIINIKNTLG